MQVIIKYDNMIEPRKIDELIDILASHVIEKVKLCKNNDTTQYTQEYQLIGK